ncbi:MAG: hypothetical protein KatS3mg002_0103 [Candidatus Woesearchaeota archaeon]|nr:MAG: hypothetical protein KatS3mg002_0103 [Candidatus Woesearchaeota archaeon]
MFHNSIKSQAENKLRIADHLLSTTYPVIKDPKLLLSALSALYQALDLAIDAVLVFEKNFKSIQYTPENKIDIFRRKIIPKYSLDNELIFFYNALKEILESHKNSDVEFTKKETFVISDKEYNLKTLTYEDVKNKYSLTKRYIEKIFEVIKKYD